MPGAGTDKTRKWVETPAPAVVLVEPQLGENIGAAARAMANFGLGRLRLVRPRCRWPSREAVIMASGADRVLDGAVLFETLEEAIGDCTFVLAATARAHDQAKPVIGADAAAREAAPRVAAGESVAFVFGRERNGLEMAEIGLADAIVTLPVNPAFASLNLAQAVAILSYEWFKHASGGALPFAATDKSRPAAKAQILAFFKDLERELEKIEYFRPAEKRETMVVNMRNIFNRTRPTTQDIQTLHGIVMALAQGRKGPAIGGVLDGGEAQMLRALLAEQGRGAMPDNRGPVRGLARLLRRNPTDAERLLWKAITSDRRLAGRGFKRQTPVGPHVADFVSFDLRAVIDLKPAGESEAAAKARAEKLAWLRERDYRVVELDAEETEKNIAAALEKICDAVSGP
ncbi:MAG TPA: TrmJ/YjtD family RNA methyltransferase [Pseudorhodoplanes sp.]|nr:TrmJ/YjtD family RNA methyltransferase [Pseudorhodoplanes sp.]